MNWIIDALYRARASTLNRIADLSEAQLDWVDGCGRTIRDIAWHIGDADYWLAHVLGGEEVASGADLSPGLGAGKDKGQIHAHLGDALARKVRMVEHCLDQLDTNTQYKSYGTITLGELILCSGLDHEAHHRGQITAIRMQNRPHK